MTTVLLVALGGALGAVCRYLLGLWLNGRAALPYGTFAANVVAALLLGVFASTAAEQVFALVGVGFCGALSTYSTLAWETHALARVRRLHALTYQLLSVTAGLAATALGWWLAR